MEPDTRKVRDLASPQSKNDNTSHAIYGANIVCARNGKKEVGSSNILRVDFFKRLPRPEASLGPFSVRLFSVSKPAHQATRPLRPFRDLIIFCRYIYENQGKNILQESVSGGNTQFVIKAPTLRPGNPNTSITQ